MYEEDSAADLQSYMQDSGQGDWTEITATEVESACNSQLLGCCEEYSACTMRVQFTLPIKASGLGITNYPHQ